MIYRYLTKIETSHVLILPNNRGITNFKLINSLINQ